MTKPGNAPSRSRRSVLLAASRLAVAAATAAWVGNESLVAGAQSGTPVAEPSRATSDAEPTPERTGRGGALQVIRDQKPRYVSAHKSGGDLVMVRPRPAGLSFNPVAAQPDPQAVVSYLEPLLRPDPVSMEPQPWLATGWAWGDDLLSMSVSLRTDVRWHDGTPFTAADVVYSLLALRDDPSSTVANAFAAVKDVTAVDDHMVAISLAERDGNLPLNALSQPMFQRAQFEAATATGAGGLGDIDWDGWRPIGTGPWRVGAVDSEKLVCTRNDAYWGPAAWLDTLTLRWVDGEANRTAAWSSRDTDVLWPVRASEIRMLGPRPGRLYAADSASVLFAAFNFANPNSQLPDLFAPVEVRRALSLAVDRQRYAAEVFGGFANIAATGTVAQPWAHDSELSNPSHDPEQAVALLSAQGWADSNGDGILENAAGVPFIIKAVLQNDLRPDLARVLARVKDDLLQVGVVLNIVPLDASALNDAITTTRDFDLIAYAFDLYPGFTDWDLYGSAWAIDRNPLGWNPGSYSNPAADAAITEFLAAASIDDQRTALVALQQSVDDDLFGLWFGFPQTLVAVSAEFDGFQPDKSWQTALTQRIWRPDRAKPPTPTPTPSSAATEAPVPTATPRPTSAPSAVSDDRAGSPVSSPAIPRVSDSGISDAPVSGTPRPGATNLLQQIP